MSVVDFELPRDLEAHEPPELRGEGRDDVRLMVTRGDEIVHAHFRQLPRFLERGDLVVLNTTATLPAALSAIREDGDVIALHVIPSVARDLGGPGGTLSAAPARPGPSLTLGMTSGSGISAAGAGALSTRLTLCPASTRYSRTSASRKNSSS